jgi:bifunctional DNA-binding transcriptional regulator/antitoxin component of YhaV-PrlF toxin-antitoxin module
MPRISSEHRVTLPLEALEQSGLGPGDEVTIEADGTGRIALRRADLPAGIELSPGLR